MEDTNHIERLPEELKLQILGFLSYQDGIRLKQVNRYFHLNLNLQCWSDSTRALFIQDAQNWDKHNQSVVCRGRMAPMIDTVTNGFACFGCFRVLPREKFSRNKTSRDHAKSSNKHVFKRLCLDCGVKQSVYQSGIVLKRTTEETIDLVSRTILVTHNSERIVLCGVCNTFSMFELLCPAGRCQSCAVNRFIWNWPPSKTPTDVTQRGMMVVRCQTCCAVQEARDPCFHRSKCKRCFRELRAFRKALKLHDKSVRKQELRKAKAISMWDQDLDEDDVLLSIERLFLSS